MDRARVGDLARAVDPDEPAGLAVAARVEGEDREVPPVNLYPSTSAFICCRLPPSPCRKTIAGQPPAGGVPSGTYSVAAIETPSSIGMERSCLAAVDPVASPATRTSAARAPQDRPSPRGGRVPRTGATPRIPAHGLPPDRRVRLGHGRADRPARVPRDDAARGLRLPRRRRAAALRAAAAGRDPPLRARDRRLPRGGRA